MMVRKKLVVTPLFLIQVPSTSWESMLWHYRGTSIHRSAVLLAMGWIEGLKPNV